MRLERARYEADRVGRRYRLVEPENRVVARTLEREWNERLTAVEALEREYAALPSPTDRLASPDEQQRILALAQDLPAIWHAATTTQAERKQLLRFLITDLTLTRTPTAIQVGLRWQTEARSTLLVSAARCAPPTGAARRPRSVARVRALAPDHTDAQIAALLDQEGATPGLGGHVHHRQGAVDPAPLCHPDGLPGAAACLSDGPAQRRPLQRACRGGPAQRRCVDHRRLVCGGHPGCRQRHAARAALDRPPARDDRAVAQADPSPLEPATSRWSRRRPAGRRCHGPCPPLAGNPDRRGDRAPWLPTAPCSFPLAHQQHPQP